MPQNLLPPASALADATDAAGLLREIAAGDQAAFTVLYRHWSNRLRREVPVSRCADVVDATTVDGLRDLLAARLDVDEHHLARVAMRHHYFDDVQVGESTSRFVEAVGELVALRDRLLGVVPDAGLTA